MSCHSSPLPALYYLYYYYYYDNVSVLPPAETEQAHTLIANANTGVKSVISMQEMTPSFALLKQDHQEVLKSKPAH